MFAAYRINNPNEIAPAHRHSPNAIRFGLTGRTNFTGVEGEPITFGPGDLVLTPHDTWHNHGNEGEGGAVNLSVLDMPLVNVLNATYFESDYFEEDGQRPQDPQGNPGGPLPSRLFAAHLRPGRAAAAQRVARPRHRERVADVCLSLGGDARRCWKTCATWTGAVMTA